MQQLQGAFPATTPSGIAGQPAVLLDFNNLGWTTGRMTIQPVTAQPTLAREWVIYGFGIQGKGLISPHSTSNPLFGRLGKLLGGLLLGSSGYGAVTQAPFALPPASALPNITTLWDGTTDPPFPVGTGTSNDLTGGMFSQTFQLPQPQPLGPGDQLAIGLWLTPALLNEVLTIIYNVTWTINYDSNPRR